MDEVDHCEAGHKCVKCRGTGRISVVDEEATDAQATWGENRIQYKKIDCDACSS